jgi:hypothetical protein
VNPFYSKPDKLKDGILNPVLKPLPEKKKVVFREWNPSADMEEKIEEPEPVVEEVIEEPEPEPIIEEVIEEPEPEPEPVMEEIEEEPQEIEEPVTEEIEEERQNFEDARINYMISEIGEKLVDNLEDESMDNSEGKKENRIITTPVQGGFRKREPQAEEVKDINSFFTRRNKRR